MKKIILLIVLTILCVWGTFAQEGEKSVGVSLGSGSTVGGIMLGVRGNYNVTDDIAITPSMNYFVKKHNIRQFETNIDCHYLLPNIREEFEIYPLLGLNYTLVNMKSFSKENYDLDYGNLGNDDKTFYHRIGINLGGGIHYFLRENMFVGTEYKYVIIGDFHQAVISLNLNVFF